MMYLAGSTVSAKHETMFIAAYMRALTGIKKSVAFISKHRAGCVRRRARLSLTHLFIALLLFLSAGTATARHPLEPLDTSSPRATMQSFLTLSEEAADRYAEFRDSPNPATQKALSQI